jgi:hypothetical protein
MAGIQMKSYRALRIGFLLLSACGLAGCRSPGQCPIKAVLPTATQTVQPAGISLFDGKTLGQWKPTDYAGAGEPRAENGTLILPFGERLTGVTWTGDMPKMNYEITLQAQRVDGSDFLVGLTFPVADANASLILGGWGGTVCGLSSLDGEDAAHNNTRSFHNFNNGQWYRVRLRVTPIKIEAWVDDEKIVDVVTTGQKLSIRAEMESSKPMGLASFSSTAAYRDIRLKMIDK